LRWLEVSIVTDGEIAEAAADVIARQAPEGLTLEPLDPTQDEGMLSGQVVVRAFLPVDDQLAHRRSRIEEGLWHLSQIKSFPDPTFRIIEEENWAEIWKARYTPIPVGEKLLIQPSWLEPADSARAILYVDPGQAFGSGAHPTTRLSLLALETYLQPGHTVFDLGCGTGILSIAAARLGASRVYAVDIDPSAVKAARENVLRNQLGDIVDVDQGSLPELAETRAQHPDPPDIVVANILAPVLEKLLKGGLSDLIQHSGKLILSGVLDEQANDLLRCSGERGLHLLQVFKEADWQALVLEK
jgi:ribosomal protein L11 methyltransferase